MIWAFYYPWYYKDSWYSPVLRDRPLKLYSSDDPKVILSHIKQVKQAGIDGFISSWWEPGHYDDKNF